MYPKLSNVHISWKKLLDPKICFYVYINDTILMDTTTPLFLVQIQGYVHPPLSHGHLLWWLELNIWCTVNMPTLLLIFGAQ